jgi:hypothetical protein
VIQIGFLEWLSGNQQFHWAVDDVLFVVYDFSESTVERSVVRQGGGTFMSRSYLD